MSMLTGEARSANVIAVGETDVIVLDHDTFAPAIENNPDLAERISHVLAERQRKLREVFGNAASDPAVDKSRTEQELLERIKRFFSL
jgi:CRP-like cAMP-binding protein